MSRVCLVASAIICRVSLCSRAAPMCGQLQSIDKFSWCLDVTTDQLVMAQCSSSRTSQKWFVDVTKSRIVSLSNAAMDKCVAGDAWSLGSKVHCATCSGGDPQVWTYDEGPGRIYHKDGNDAYWCVDIGMNNPDAIQVWECNDMPNQAFQVVASDCPFTTTTTPAPPPITPAPAPPSGRLVSQLSQRCLDLPGGNVEDGQPLWTWDCLGSDNQKWVFHNGAIVYDGGSVWTKCVDVPNADYTNGNYLELWECGGWPQQQWTVDEAAQTVQLAGESKCMALSGDSVGSGNGVNLMIWDCDGTAPQSWLYSVTTGEESHFIV